MLKLLPSSAYPWLRAMIHPEHVRADTATFYNFPSKVISDDETTLPSVIPDGLRCGCPLGCVKLMQYCGSGEIAIGRCYGCEDCDSVTSFACFCECLGCEEAFKKQTAKLGTPSQIFMGPKFRRAVAYKIRARRSRSDHGLLSIKPKRKRRGPRSCSDSLCSQMT